MQLHQLRNRQHHVCKTSVPRYLTRNSLQRRNQASSVDDAKGLKPVASFVALMCAPHRCQKHNHVMLSQVLKAWATCMAEKTLHVCGCHASNFTAAATEHHYCSLPQCTSMLNTQRGLLTIQHCSPAG